MPRNPFVVKFRVDLFAYTICSLSFGWVLMNLLHAWTLDILIQAVIVLLESVVWALYGHLALESIKRRAVRQAKLHAELAAIDRIAKDPEQT
jgi:hypothetical protein